QRVRQRAQCPGVGHSLDGSLLPFCHVCKAIFPKIALQAELRWPAEPRRPQGPAVRGHPAEPGPPALVPAVTHRPGLAGEPARSVPRAPPWPDFGCRAPAGTPQSRLREALATLDGLGAPAATAAARRRMK